MTLGNLNSWQRSASLTKRGLKSFLNRGHEEARGYLDRLARAPQTRAAQLPILAEASAWLEAQLQAEYRAQGAVYGDDDAGFARWCNEQPNAA